MKFWAIVFGTTLLLCGGVVAYLALVHEAAPLSEKEKQAALGNLLGRTPILTLVPKDNSQKTFEGKLIQLVYPSAGRVYTSFTMPTDSLSYGLLDEHTMVSVQAQSSDLKLSEYGPVVIRQRQNTLYTGIPTTFLDNHCVSFLKTEDSVEQSVFCKKGTKMVSVVVTGPDKDDVGKTLVTVEESLHLR